MNRVARWAKKNPETITNIAIFALIFFFLLSYFKPSLLFLNTTLTGGDTPAHNYLARYLRDALLPQGKIIGWAPGWWAGFPLFQYYFFPPYLFTALLSYIIPFNIAFKLSTVVGIFLLPITTFFCLRLMKQKFPVPIIGAILTLPFLFVNSHKMWGVNVYSTLAGEIANSWGFAFMVLYLGMLYRDVKRNKFSHLTSLVLAITIFSHLTTGAIAIVAGAFFLGTKKYKQKAVILFKIYGLAFLLVAFWALPLVFKLKYAIAFGDDWDINLIQTFPKWYALVVACATAVLINSLKNKTKQVWFFGFLLLVSFAIYKFGYYINMVNIRAWPLIYFFPFMLAAIASGLVLQKLRAKCIVPFILLFVLLVYINHSSGEVNNWVKWNYAGFETKPSWPTYQSINEFLKGKMGRTANDLADANNRFGSPRAFEAAAYFINAQTIEGGIIQSGLSSPYVMYIQCEISHHCAGFPRMVTPTNFNLANATVHLRLYNVKYIIAYYDRLKQELSTSADWKRVQKIGDYEIHELLTNDGNYVFVPSYEPVLINTSNWQKLSLKWFYNASNVDLPLVFKNGPEFEKEGAFRIRASEDELINYLAQNASKRELRKKMNTSCTIQEHVEDATISFVTSCPGKPHIIKISYYPNWKVTGAKKIYLVSPSFMLVFPEANEVTLYYGSTFIDILGMVLTATGILLLVVHGVKRYL